MAACYCYCLGIKSNDFFLKDNKKAFILWLNVPKVTAYTDFADEDAFVKYTNRYSVFGEEELRGWYKNKDYFTVIKMVYNIAFTKKVINKVMKERVGLNPRYWGFFRLTDAQFDKLLELGEINERYIVD